ncbi:MAG: VWA domain-containing protein [Betaproteobacteria bacterium]|nr:VWA domain-containing protein [Betaproteobacteria bacterium]NBP45905.1 VWA domain-containing protein [Betaproteobacteria bacterium]
MNRQTHDKPQSPITPAQAAWELAQCVVHLMQIDAHAVGGLWLRAAHGPVRSTWLNALDQAFDPLVKLPLNVDWQGLHGGIDLSLSLREGRVQWQSGALQRAHGGVVVLPMAERAPSELCASLGQCLDTPRVQAQSMASPQAASWGLVALDEADDDEPGLHAALADRLAFWLDLRQLSMWDAPAFEPLSAPTVHKARALRAQLQPDPQRMQRLGQAGWELGIASARATWLAWQVALSHAALQGRDHLDDEDEHFAMLAVLMPRATRMPAPPQQPDPALQEQESAPAPPSSEAESSCEPPADPAPQDESPNESSDAGHDEQDMTVESACAALPPDLLAQCLAAGWSSRSQRASATGLGQRSRTQGASGRPLPARAGRPHGGARLDLPTSLRHAIARQRLREQDRQAAPEGASSGRLLWRMEDLHVRRRQPSERCCVILAVDASGSTALQRLAQAKGAVELLLAQSYVRRDAVCVVGFRGREAQCLLPATRSLVRAKRVLAAMTGGGGTPIASALSECVQQAMQLGRQGLTPLLIVLSDGRANVSLEGIGGRAQAHSDAMGLAQRVRLMGLSSVWVDTAPQPEPLAQALSNAMGARYVPMPQVRSQQLAQVMQSAMSEARITASA